MTIANFTPIAGLEGGALIGLSAATLLLLNGDILGASGIASTACLDPMSTLQNQPWKFVLLASFLFVTAWKLESEYNLEIFQQGGRAVTALGYVVGGLFVGFGTKVGNGCTTGHGICGLARFSKRSFAAVMSFMMTAIAVSHMTRGIPQLQTTTDNIPLHRIHNVGYFLALTFALLGLIVAPVVQQQQQHSKGNNNNNSRAKLGPAALSGILFAAGLHTSTMVYPSKVFGFLNMSGIFDENSSNFWDPSLMCVMGGGVVVSMISYQFVPDFCILNNTKQQLSSPVVCKNAKGFENIPKNQIIDWQLLLGAVCFGIGWGTAGICPGPAIYMAGMGATSAIFYWWPAFFVGSYLGIQVKEAAAAVSAATKHDKKH